MSEHKSGRKRTCPELRDDVERLKRVVVKMLNSRFDSAAREIAIDEAWAALRATSGHRFRTQVPVPAEPVTLESALYARPAGGLVRVSPATQMLPEIARRFAYDLLWAATAAEEGHEHGKSTDA